MIHYDGDVPRRNRPDGQATGVLYTRTVAKRGLVFGAWDRNVTETTPEPFCWGARGFFGPLAPSPPCAVCLIGRARGAATEGILQAVDAKSARCTAAHWSRLEKHTPWSLAGVIDTKDIHCREPAPDAVKTADNADPAIINCLSCFLRRRAHHRLSPAHVGRLSPVHVGRRICQHRQQSVFGVDQVAARDQRCAVPEGKTEASFDGAFDSAVAPWPPAARRRLLSRTTALPGGHFGTKPTAPPRVGDRNAQILKQNQTLNADTCSATDLSSGRKVSRSALRVVRVE
jgi:hypothetical protein